MANRRRRRRKEQGQARAATVNYADVKLQRDIERMEAADERQRVQQQRVETRGAIGRQMAARRKARDIAARAGRPLDPTFRTVDPETGRATTLKGAETEFERQYRERTTGQTKPTPFFKVPGAEGDKDELVLTGGATRLEDVRRAGIQREVETRQTGTATTELPVSEREREQLTQYYPRVERTGEAAAVEQFEGVELAVHGELAEFNRQAAALRKDLARRAELLELDPDQIEALDLSDEQLGSKLLGGLAPRVRAMRAIREDILGRLNRAAEDTNRARQAQRTISPETQERMTALGPASMADYVAGVRERAGQRTAPEAAVADDDQRAVARARALAARRSEVNDTHVDASPATPPGARLVGLPPTTPTNAEAAQRLRDKAIIQRARTAAQQRTQLGVTTSPGADVVMRVRRAGQSGAQTTVGKMLDMASSIRTPEERTVMLDQLDEFVKQDPEFTWEKNPALHAAYKVQQARLRVEETLIPKDRPMAAGIQALGHTITSGKTLADRQAAWQVFVDTHGDPNDDDVRARLERDNPALKAVLDSVIAGGIAIERERDRQETYALVEQQDKRMGELRRVEQTHGNRLKMLEAKRTRWESARAAAAAVAQTRGEVPGINARLTELAPRLKKASTAYEKAGRDVDDYYASLERGAPAGDEVEPTTEPSRRAVGVSPGSAQNVAAARANWSREMVSLFDRDPDQFAKRWATLSSEQKDAISRELSGQGKVKAE